jgi:hypothetical protein
MRLKTRSFSSHPDLGANGKYQLSFYGDPLDDRGRQAVALCQSEAAKNYRLTYNQNSYFVDGRSLDLGRLGVLVRGAKNILIDCTTLGVVEIIYILRAARIESVRDLSLLYAEPGEYAREEKEGLAAATRFNLTKDRQFSAVHGVSLDLSLHLKGQAIFMLGYEEDRLAMLLTQQENLAQFDRHAIFGVPAFEAGWELNSFANHASSISNDEFNVHYAGANSVTDSYQKLLEIYGRKTSPDIPTVIAPIGTKPHAIAAALFICERSQHGSTALIYDHPQKKDGHSRLLRRWHLYEVGRMA